MALFNSFSEQSLTRIKRTIIDFSFSRFRSLLGLSFLFVILNAVLFFITGIKVVDDSPRYLNYTQELRSGIFFIDPHNIWYIGYPIFMVLVRTIHDSLRMVIFSQYLLSFLALYAVYFTSYQLFNNYSTAFWTALLYIMFFEISIYNSYILCESFFVSMTCFSVFLLAKWFKKESSLFNLLFGIPILLLTISAKPTGIVILAAIAAQMYYLFFNKLEITFLRILFGLLLIIPIFFLANKMLTTFGFINEYIRGDIIFGMFQFRSSPFYDLLTISRPEIIYIPDANYPPIIRLVLFVIFNPIYWGKLFFSKLFFFFFHIRPFWSTWHNIYSLVYLTPVYFFTFQALLSKKVNFEIKLFVAVYVLLHGFIVGLMTEDWDGRFLIPILPVLVIPAGLGLASLIDRK